jgi:hypothetical protein
LPRLSGRQQQTRLEVCQRSRQEMTMDSVWSTVNWIDGWLGPYGTVAIVGGMIAGFLYWMLSASR